MPRLPYIRLLAVLVLALAVAVIGARSQDVPLMRSPRPVLSSGPMGPHPPTLLPPGFVWTKAHDDALRLYKGPRKTFSVFRLLTGGPMTRDQITQWLGGDGFARANMEAILRDLLERGLTQAPFAQDFSTILLNPYGQQVAQAMAEIPENVKSYAMCWNWTRSYCPQWYYPLPPP